MEQFCQVTDNILLQILNSDSDDLQPAKEIVEKIMRRDIYKCVFENKLPGEVSKNIKEFKNCMTLCTLYLRVVGLFSFKQANLFLLVRLHIIDDV